MTYTVITACLNAAETLCGSLDSVAAQGRLPERYVIVDGGSTDGTLDVVDDFKSRMAEAAPEMEVVLVHQDRPSGIAGAWNLGLERAVGDVVSILNADDWYEPGAVLAAMNAFKDNPDADIVAGAVWFHPEDGSPSRISHCKSFCWFPFLMPVMHPACFVKKKVYDELGGFDENTSLSMDYDFVYRCFNAGKRFEIVNVPLANMRLGGRANSARDVARRETRDAALRNGAWFPLPWAAYFARKYLGR